MPDEVFLVVYRIGGGDWSATVLYGRAKLDAWHLVADMDDRWEIRALPLDDVLALPRWKWVRADIQLEDVDASPAPAGREGDDERADVSHRPSARA